MLDDANTKMLASEWAVSPDALEVNARLAAGRSQGKGDSRQVASFQGKATPPDYSDSLA